MIYRDSSGARVPSVTTILSRFKDSGGLLYWANECGLNGQTLDQARAPATTAGTIAHAMVEADIHGKVYTPHGSPDIIAKAANAFAAYKSWSQMTRLEVLYTEVPLVSNIHRFGGCLDAVGIVRAVGNGLAMCDWKTSNALYADYALQLAAYGILWNETYPDSPIEGGYHLLRFAKEEGDFVHAHFPDLSKEAQTFLKMRELYDMVKSVEKRFK
jgi:hypothetical protein